MSGFQTRMVITQSVVSGYLPSGEVNLNRGPNKIPFSTAFPDVNYVIMAYAYNDLGNISWELTTKAIDSITVTVEDACHFVYIANKIV
jgi:hypothetical protein